MGISKNFINNVLALRRQFPTGLTTRKELLAVIATLHPVCTDKGLLRLGSNGDGGYLVPNDLEGIKACFSPGVSLESEFEKDCADLGMNVFLADKSVEGPAIQHELFHFTKKYLGVTSNDDFFTINDWVESALPETDSELLLQIDIEGYEYEVFLSASDQLMRRFRIIVAEFHQLDQLWNKPFFSLAGRTFEKILQTHACVHIHPNNCCGSLRKDGIDIPTTMEFTFLRRDRISSHADHRNYPNPLDFDNTDNPSLPLPKDWYGGIK